MFQEALTFTGYVEFAADGTLTKFITEPVNEGVSISEQKITMQRGKKKRSLSLHHDSELWMFYTSLRAMLAGDPDGVLEIYEAEIVSGEPEWEVALSPRTAEFAAFTQSVTVKGSSVQQKIFTYDAKVRSDFFLYSKTESQADLDSDRYSPAIWNTDQDLVAMRSHICDEFMEVFNRGRDEYLAGNWPAAIKLLKSADKIMFEREVEEGYSTKSYADSNLKSLTTGDGKPATLHIQTCPYTTRRLP